MASPTSRSRMLDFAIIWRYCTSLGYTGLNADNVFAKKRVVGDADPYNEWQKNASDSVLAANNIIAFERRGADD